MTSNKKAAIQVVAALLRTDRGVLIAKRSTGNPEVLGKWEFPGGKIEPEESEQEAIRREINEEFGIVISAGDVIAETTISRPSKQQIILKLVECEYLSGTMRLNDHSDFAYIDQNDIDQYDFAPADKAFLAYI